MSNFVTLSYTSSRLATSHKWSTVYEVAAGGVDAGGGGVGETLINNEKIFQDTKGFSECYYSTVSSFYLSDTTLRFPPNKIKSRQIYVCNLPTTMQKFVFSFLSFQPMENG